MRMNRLSHKATVRERGSGEIDARTPGCERRGEGIGRVDTARTLGANPEVLCAAHDLGEQRVIAPSPKSPVEVSKVDPRGAAAREESGSLGWVQSVVSAWCACEGATCDVNSGQKGELRHAPALAHPDTPKGDENAREARNCERDDSEDRLLLLRERVGAAEENPSEGKHDVGENHLRRPPAIHFTASRRLMLEGSYVSSRSSSASTPRRRSSTSPASAPSTSAGEVSPSLRPAR